MKKFIFPFILLISFSLVSLSGAATNPFSTFIGGTQFDSIKASAVLEDGSIVVAGHTNSLDYPTTAGAFDTTCGTDTACQSEFLLGDAFVSKFAADGTLVFSTFLGGSQDDGAHDVAVTADGTIVVVGFTKSADFPTTTTAFDQSFNDFEGVEFGDGFIVKLSSDGSQLLYSSFIGSDRQDEVLTVAIQSNDVYFAGFTQADDFPTTVGAFDTGQNGNADGFVGKLSSDGTSLSYSTFLGGDAFDTPRAIAVNSAGEITVAGSTQSSNFPTTSGAADTVMAGSNEGFVARLNNTGSTLIYSTLIGGDLSDRVSDLVLDETGKAYVIGTTFSSDFAATAGAFDTTKSLQDDGFFSIINETGTDILYTTFTNLFSNGRHSGIAINLAEDGSVFLGLSISETGIFGQQEPGFLWLNPAGNGENDLILDCRRCFRFDEGDLNDMAMSLNGVVLVGETDESSFTTSAGAFDTSHNGDHDGFVIHQLTPTSNDVDLTLELPDFAAGEPNSTVSLPISYGNTGATTALNVQITMTLAANLTYVSDTSGVVPQQNGNRLTWNLSNLEFSSADRFSVQVQLPNANIGDTFGVSAEINSDGPESNATNNNDSVDVMVATQIYLPAVVR